MATNEEIKAINNANLLAFNEQKMCHQTFLLKIKDELTISCSIPVKIPDRNIINMIGRSKEWFYKHYEYSVEDAYLFVDQSMFDTDQYEKERSITLPKDIYSVFGVHKVGLGFTNIAKDNFVNYSNSYITIGNEGTTEDLMGYVIAEKYGSMREDLLTDKFTAFSFNNLTHKFRLAGETPSTALVLKVYKVISDCDLFSDELFFRYVVAHAQKNIATVLGMFGYVLPGNISINYDLIKALGEDEIAKIEEQVKAEEGTDWFMIG